MALRPKQRMLVLGLWIALGGCTEEATSTSERSTPLIQETPESDSAMPNVTPVDTHTFDTSFDLYSINSTASRHYRAEYIPLSERLLSGIEPDLSIIPDSLLGDSVQTYSDTVVLLTGSYRAAALEYAGVQETDSVFIYNFDQDVVVSRSVSELPLVAFINVYGADLPVTTTDYMFGLDIQSIAERKKKNYYELESASIHHANPFVTGAARKIVWTEMDTSDYPGYLKEDIQNYHPDRCFRFEFEQFIYYCRTYVRNEVPSGFKMDVVRNDTALLSLTAFSGEGSEPVLSMLYGYESINQWTGRLFRDMPPMVYNLYSVSFGCEKIFFIQQEQLFKHIICDNRH